MITSTLHVTNINENTNPESLVPSCLYSRYINNFQFINVVPLHNYICNAMKQMLFLNELRIKKYLLNGVCEYFSSYFGEINI